MRLSVLRKRATLASLLGFVALFGLASQHSVKGTAAKTAASRRRASRRATFFDERASDFSFGDEGFAPSESATPQVRPPSGPPLAQSSVS